MGFGTQIAMTDAETREIGSYRVLARRYRPARFDELIGQEREKDAPDPNVIDANEREQKRLRDLRDTLDPKNPPAIEDVIATYGPQARDLYAN